MVLSGGVPMCAAGVSSRAATNPAAARNVRKRRLGFQTGCDRDVLGVV
jgi:hypothetical protein